ncbi:MAG TPA: glycoside hydrolase family 5 protein [Thermoclostridium caenicola]|uniref:glycoside hydrolase family 5 protein n=1 Tax=Thermoclostridium caenicola TaxID=659425 RepID=UPI002CD0461A|nr:glycoside hydrolase family 5 protein [Thermoclostridium caenicola]HOK42426.1 glycoside hydrolase family 5 protein [Thermoclostridium caenicola]HOL85268.1 glycoside hydrolase family 5 protein [Thermoclostridium caenicola]HPO76946.1 glycoside hydrolase family 5 protein [Thermoclostridium caenicola]
MEKYRYKKKAILWTLVLSLILIFLPGCGETPPEIVSETPPSQPGPASQNPPEATPEATPEPAEPTPDSGPTVVELNGQLRVEGTQLVNEAGQPVQLKGVSTHEVASFGYLVTYNALKQMRDDWNLTVFRIAMYTEDATGYIRNPAVKDIVTRIIDDCIDLGIYVIVDWHILYDNTPLKYKDQAVEFFSEISARYGDYPNIIYEICNEPNGANTTWEGHIKPYADEVIPAIRKNDPDNIIIVGTPTWSQDVDIAADDPLPYDNVMYALHFYAGSHGQFLRDKIDYALSKGLPIFVSEWGSCLNTGDGPTFHEESMEWIKFLDERNISYVNWSYSTKQEGASILRKQIDVNAKWTDIDLTEGGLFTKYAIKGTKETVLFADGFETKTFGHGKWKRSNDSTTYETENPYKGKVAASIGKDGFLERAVTTVPYENLKLHLAYTFVNGNPGDAVRIEWFDGSSYNLVTELPLADEWLELDVELPDNASGVRDFSVRITAAVADGNTRLLVDEIWLAAEKK